MTIFLEISLVLLAVIFTVITFCNGWDLSAITDGITGILLCIVGIGIVDSTTHVQKVITTSGVYLNIFCLYAYGGTLIFYGALRFLLSFFSKKKLRKT